MMNRQVLVFTTSVESFSQVKMLANDLNGVAGKGNWNFALDDCDRILRVSAPHVQAEVPIRILQAKGFKCAELD